MVDISSQGLVGMQWSPLPREDQTSRNILRLLLKQQEYNSLLPGEKNREEKRKDQVKGEAG